MEYGPQPIGWFCYCGLPNNPFDCFFPSCQGRFLKQLEPYQALLNAAHDVRDVHMEGQPDWAKVYAKLDK